MTDFRSGDVALGGQGAPLVPIGDEMLFSDYEFCLNLGGFANISYVIQHRRVAFDICPVNIILNYFAEKKEMPFDKDGILGRAGKVKQELLYQLNHIPYYQKSPPKSLGREWLENEYFPVLKASRYSDDNQLRTIYEHIAMQISQNVKGEGKLLLTGGGAFNSFLTDLILNYTTNKIVLPDSQIINYKEAVIFVIHP